MVFIAILSSPYCILPPYSSAIFFRHIVNFSHFYGKLITIITIITMITIITIITMITMINYDNYNNYNNCDNYNKYYDMQLCILTNCTICNIRQNSKKPMLISLNLIANPGDPNNRRKPLEIRNDPFPPVSSKVNLVNARELLDSRRGPRYLKHA